MHTTAPPPVEADVQRFTSRHYPASRSYRWVAMEWIVRPLAFCMLPVMIGALIAILEGFSGLPFLTLGFPLALLMATAWTWYRVHATLAAISIRAGEASVHTVWETLRDPSPHALMQQDWLPIFEIRKGPSFLSVALGDATYTLERRDWPELDQLLDALQDARAARYGRS